MPSVSRKVPAQAGVRSRTYVTNLKWPPPNVDLHDLIERDAVFAAIIELGGAGGGMRSVIGENGLDCDRNGTHSEGPFDLGNEDGQTNLICACCERLPNLLAVRREDGKARTFSVSQVQPSVATRAALPRHCGKCIPTLPRTPGRMRRSRAANPMPSLLMTGQRLKDVFGDLGCF